MKTYQQSGWDLISMRSYSKSFICSDKLDGLKKYCVLSDFVSEMHFWLHIFDKYFHRFSIIVKFMPNRSPLTDTSFNLEYNLSK